MLKKLALTFVSIIISLTSLAPLGVAVAVGTNLITNPSVETADATGTLPASWTQNKWGTNTTTFAYKTNEGNDGIKSLYINMTNRTSGDAKWMATPVPVKPNKKYTYTEFYKSNVATEVDIEYTDTANKVSYVWLGTAAASATNWQAKTYSLTTPANVKTLSVFHVINKVGWLQTDNFSLVEDGATPTPSPTPPTVSFTAPVANATVSGTQALSATATDAVGVAGVQFKVDNANLGAEDTVAPYGVNWNTSSIANGNHTLTAIARNAAGLTATSTVIANVQNVVAPPPTPIPSTNLILNPSFETAQNATTPQSWIAGNWGTNTAVFSYLNTGRTGSRSVKTEVTAYTNGAANWYYNDVNVTSGKSYKYENWYQSNVDSEIDAEVLMDDGTIQYFYITTALASAGWAKATGTFTVPAGAKALAIYQILAKKGYVIADDYSLTEYTPAQLSRGLVSLSFDDGWRSIYTNGLPLLNKYGFVSTQYLLTSTIDYPDYMTVAMMAAFRGQGSEIAAHTVNHLDLTQQTAATVTYELSQNKTDLQNWLGVTVSNFATPYGAYNGSVISAIKQYYRSHRSVDEGFNTKDSFDIYNIKVQNILNTTTPAQVKVWVDQAIREKTWLVLVYHEVDASPADSTYAVTPANLDAELNYIKQSGASVKTVNQALNEILAQL